MSLNLKIFCVLKNIQWGACFGGRWLDCGWLGGWVIMLFLQLVVQNLQIVRSWNLACKCTLLGKWCPYIFMSIFYFCWLT